MVNIILASHGKFAEGILQSAEMIFGEQEELETVIFMPNEGPEDLKSKLDDAAESFGPNAEILIMVDLWGGSPFNQASIIHEENPERTAIVSGLNLPMLLEALGGRMGMDSAHDLASTIIKGESTGIRVKPESLEPEAEESAEENDGETPLPSGGLPEGKVLGDGKIEYVLARIDTRLLHGQVATSWSKAVNPNRIIVVSDKVAQDSMRKSLIQQAAPPGVRASTIPISKLAEIDDDPRFGATKALLLFETPQDVLEAVEAGVELDEVNIGSMAHASGKTMVSKAISVDQDDIDTLEALKDHGVTFDVRILPGDNRKDIRELLKKEDLI